MRFDLTGFFDKTVDFLATLLPGLFLVFFASAYWVGAFAPLDLDNGYVLLVVAYFLGHLVFVVARLLDRVYDKLRNASTWGQIRFRLARGKARVHPILRKVSGILFGRHPDYAVILAERLKAMYLGRYDAEFAMNAYQWSKLQLMKHNPDSLQIVRGHEMQSKLMRSTAFVFALLGVMVLSAGTDELADHPHQLQLVLAFSILALLSFYGYLIDRFKATQRAFWGVIDLFAENGRGTGIDRKNPAHQPGGLSHAGGIVFRYGDAGQKGGRKPEFLLVQAKSGPKPWVLPKGHIEAGEEPAVTAVREVWEEGAIWARVAKKLKEGKLGKEENAPTVRWYLMEYLDDASDSTGIEGREIYWIRPDQFGHAEIFDETRELLGCAEQEIKSLQPDL